MTQAKKAYHDPRKLILAVGLGTSGMEVVLITISGKVLGWEAEAVELLITLDRAQSNYRMSGNQR